MLFGKSGRVLHFFPVGGVADVVVVEYDAEHVVYHFWEVALDVVLLGAGLGVEGDGVREGREEVGEDAKVVREGGALAVDIGVGEGGWVGGGGGHCAVVFLEMLLVRCVGWSVCLCRNFKSWWKCVWLMLGWCVGRAWSRGRVLGIYTFFLTGR